MVRNNPYNKYVRLKLTEVHTHEEANSHRYPRDQTLPKLTEMPVGKSTWKNGQIMFEKNRSACPKRSQSRVKVGKLKLGSLIKQLLNPSPKHKPALHFSYHLQDTNVKEAKKPKKQKRKRQRREKGDGWKWKWWGARTNPSPHVFLNKQENKRGKMSSLTLILP